MARMPPPSPSASAVTVFVARNMAVEGAADILPVTFGRGTSLHAFRKLAAEALEMRSPKRVFFEDGSEVNHVDQLTEGQLCFISSGEPFHRSDVDALVPRKGRFYLSVMGSAGVGKSALTQRLLHEIFVPDHDPTIEDAYRKQMLVDGSRDELEILDTAGQEAFESFRHQWMSNKDAVVFVFSLTDRSSLDALDDYGQLYFHENWRKTVTPPLLLVGSKKDLVEDGTRRQVSPVEANQKLFKWRGLFHGCECRLGPMVYLETSSKTGENVEAAFELLVREIRRCRAAHRKQTRQRQSSVSRFLPFFGCSC